MKIVVKKGENARKSAITKVKEGSAKAKSDHQLKPGVKKKSIILTDRMICKEHFIKTYSLHSSSIQIWLSKYFQLNAIWYEMFSILAPANGIITHTKVFRVNSGRQRYRWVFEEVDQNEVLAGIKINTRGKEINMVCQEKGLITCFFKQNGDQVKRGYPVMLLARPLALFKTIPDELKDLQKFILPRDGQTEIGWSTLLLIKYGSKYFIGEAKPIIAGYSGLLTHSMNFSNAPSTIKKGEHHQCVEYFPVNEPLAEIKLPNGEYIVVRAKEEGILVSYQVIDPMVSENDIIAFYAKKIN